MISQSHNMYKTCIFFCICQFYWLFIKGFSKIVALLISTLKTIIVDKNIDNNSKSINNFEVNIQKKKLSKGNKNSNRTDFFF